MTLIFDIDDRARLPWRFFKTLQSMGHRNLDY